MRPVIQAPNQILREPTKPVALSAQKLRPIIAEMKAILISRKDPEGVGLAANQIGLPHSLFLARFETKNNSPVFVFINPEIIAHSAELQPKENEKSQLEGCLSLPKYYGLVKRWQWVQLKYINEQWAMCNEKFEGFAATVIQHEMDHLTGKIFVERILEQNGKLFKTTGKDKKGKEVWEEVEL